MSKEWHMFDVIIMSGNLNGQSLTVDKMFVKFAYL
jgi:hypothetical protein